MSRACLSPKDICSDHINLGLQAQVPALVPKAQPSLRMQETKQQLYRSGMGCPCLCHQSGLWGKGVLSSLLWDERKRPVSAGGGGVGIEGWRVLGVLSQGPHLEWTCPCLPRAVVLIAPRSRPYRTFPSGGGNWRASPGEMYGECSDSPQEQDQPLQPRNSPWRVRISTAQQDRIGL